MNFMLMLLLVFISCHTPNAPKEPLKLTVSLVGKGRVVKQPDKPFYDFGEHVKLTAEPDMDWVFDHWEGDFNVKRNPLVFVMDDDISLTAFFTTHFQKVIPLKPWVVLAGEKCCLYEWGQFTVDHDGVFDLYANITFSSPDEDNQDHEQVFFRFQSMNKEIQPINPNFHNDYVTIDIGKSGKMRVYAGRFDLTKGIYGVNISHVSALDTSILFPNSVHGDTLTLKEVGFSE